MKLNFPLQHFVPEQILWWQQGTTADIVASAAGMKIAGIRSINLNDLAIQPPFPPAPIPLAKQSLATAEQARPTPVISGQEEVSTNIAVVFLIQ